MKKVTQKTTRFYTVKELAETLRVHINTVYKAIRCGRIQAMRVGSRTYSNYRIPESEMDRMLEFDSKALIDKIIDEKIKQMRGE